MTFQLSTAAPRVGLAVTLIAAALALAGQALPTRAAEPSALQSEGRSRGRSMLVYIGTYTKKDSKGVYAYRLDMATGHLTPVTSGPMTPNPSFLAIHPNHRFLYVVNELQDFGGGKTGGVTAFRIDPKSGALTQLNQQKSEGLDPCFITVDAHGKNVLVANYSSGSAACLPIMADGTLGPASSVVQHHGTGPNKSRQEGPHAHSINLDASNRHALVADLGLDKVMVYRFDPAKGSLLPNDPPFGSVAPGAGPRHLVFSPEEKHVYVMDEVNSTVTAFNYDNKSGKLDEIQAVSTLPEGFKGSNTTADIHLSPNGRFLYGSNRGHDSIVIFRVDPATGRLSYVGHQSTQGKTPRNFGIDPTGRYLLAANQDSDSVVVFRIDPDSGQLTPTGTTVEVSMPVCVKFMPDAK